MALSDKFWWTRKSRIRTERRLLSNARQTQLLLLWYAGFSAAVAVYYLKFNTDSQYSDVAWVIFSILILSISGHINSQKYKERAALVKASYEALNGLYQRAKKTSSEMEDELVEEYQKILNVCENQTDVDYYFALCEEHLTDSANGLDRHPTRYMWIQLVLYKGKRFLFLFGLYALPIILFFYMEY